MPLVCLALTAKTIAEDMAIIERYRSMVDLVELRADLLDPSEAFALRDFPALAGLPCILTMRRKCDGGGFVDGEGQRLVTLAKAIAFARPDATANYTYIDLECDFHVPAIEEACHTFGTRIIRSMHDMAGMPEDLDAAWAGLVTEPHEIPKLAVTPKNAGDLARFFAWAESLPPGEKIVIAMGEYGMPSRILSERLGTSIAYSSAVKSGLPLAAPGHLDPAALEEVYRFRTLGRKTAIYALGGSNVLGSRTTVLHNQAFRSLGMDAVYLPLPADNVDDLLEALSAIKASGASVGVPLKAAILPKLSHRSPEVDEMGFCTTLVKSPEGWTGYNTDASAFRRALLEFLDRDDLHGLRASILGAGSFAKAAAYVLAELGASAVILNRTVSKARDIASKFGFAYGPITEHAGDLVADHSDLIIQATRVGMEGEIQGDPLDWYDFSGREAVFDLIYRPEQTVLLERAKAARCKVSNGWKMLRYQSAAQFQLWTGTEAPSSYTD